MKFIIKIFPHWFVQAACIFLGQIFQQKIASKFWSNREPWLGWSEMITQASGPCCHQPQLGTLQCHRPVSQPASRRLESCSRRTGGSCHWWSWAPQPGRSSCGSSSPLPCSRWSCRARDTRIRYKLWKPNSLFRFLIVDQRAAVFKWWHLRWDQLE